MNGVDVSGHAVIFAAGQEGSQDKDCEDEEPYERGDDPENVDVKNDEGGHDGDGEKTAQKEWDFDGDEIAELLEERDREGDEDGLAQTRVSEVAEPGGEVGKYIVHGMGGDGGQGKGGEEECGDGFAGEHRSGNVGDVDGIAEYAQDGVGKLGLAGGEGRMDTGAGADVEEEGRGRNDGDCVRSVAELMGDVREAAVVGEAELDGSDARGAEGLNHADGSLGAELEGREDGEGSAERVACGEELGVGREGLEPLLDFGLDASPGAMEAEMTCGRSPEDGVGIDEPVLLLSRFGATEDKTGVALVEIADGLG